MWGKWGENIQMRGYQPMVSASIERSKYLLWKSKSDRLYNLDILYASSLCMRVNRSKWDHCLHNFWLTDLMTDWLNSTVVLDQPMASPISANYLIFVLLLKTLLNLDYHTNCWIARFIWLKRVSVNVSIDWSAKLLI